MGRADRIPDGLPEVPPEWRARLQAIAAEQRRDGLVAPRWAAAHNCANRSGIAPLNSAMRAAMMRFFRECFHGPDMIWYVKREG